MYERRVKLIGVYSELMGVHLMSGKTLEKKGAHWSFKVTYLAFKNLN